MTSGEPPVISIQALLALGGLTDELLNCQKNPEKISERKAQPAHDISRQGGSSRSLTQMATRFGWEANQIQVIDEDQGLSGSSAEGRAGFQKILTEVAFYHVGIILGVDMSRLARSNKDFHHLLELCARFGTLIADLDGLYDPSTYNDRLLLGLKGTMSEAELHILRQRLYEGKVHKAKRGDLSKPVPSGYLKLPDGEVVIDPDEEAQAVVKFVFDEFDRFASMSRIVRLMAEKGMRIGVRRRVRPDIGKLEWHRPHTAMIGNILRNPIYAGAYVYGRSRSGKSNQGKNHSS